MRLATDGPERDGVFVLEGGFERAGRFPARLVFTSEAIEETFDFGQVVVHATHEEAETAPTDDHEHEDGVRFLMEQQWKVGLLLAEAGPATVTRRLTVPAEVVAAEGASAVVTAPLAGRLLPPEDAPLPVTGEVVTAGQVLARVEPPLSTADGAQLRALELEWDLKALDVERALAEAESHLTFAEADHARVVDLRADKLSSQQQLDQAERDLALARSMHATAKNAESALQVQRAQRKGLTMTSDDGMLQFVVPAPIGGVLVAEGRVVGASVEAHEALFRIVDPSRVWIEGRVSEFELPLVTMGPPALAAFPAVPELHVPVADPVLAPEVEAGSRTISLRYELEVPPNGVVRPGMLAELEVAVETVEAGVVIPYEAIVLEGGLPFAYVMHEGELFERREVELGLRDGKLVEVRAGVEAGDRVVTRGATTVRLAAMAPASFGHQHQH